MKSILVTSTEEGTGKTAIALALAKLASERGLDVGYMKPKGTRLQSAVGKTRDEDPMLARELLDIDDPMHELEPVVYSPTFVDGALRGQEDPDQLRDRIRTAFDGLAEGRDLMVIEGGGSMSTGGIVDLTDADVADLLDAEVLLVTRYEQPRDVDDVLAAAEQVGDRLAGVVFNAVADADVDAITTDVAPFLDGRGVPVLGVLPRVQEMAGVTVADLAESIGADVLTTGVDTDAFVERFTVGAMGSDSALRQFRRLRDAAMITGGDRANVQTAALEAPGIKCLVLTGGLQPPGAVLGRAESGDVPVLTVQTDTKTTIDRVEEVLRSGRTRTPESVAKMQSLLDDGVDLESLLDVE
ncbi:phosphotransacetylase family protein [Haloarculaceae archaeon H-GB2-1]|nr:phosphotransacetylase family protein [Haloarculaceae archaeon H-GB1-1]MEA5386610.1 phosphotransacetylase family protein [Haloarculaceae archaeon H-GB11]MEA5408128.1 phosphotransacetylase family protein [Haloarculaceae archaeon H-GB2-1]